VIATIFVPEGVFWGVALACVGAALSGTLYRALRPA
jgi:hypothetical protein